LVGPLKLVRSAIWSFLISALLLDYLGAPAAKAGLPLSALFWPMCIGVSELAEDLEFKTRNDLAERVRSAVQGEVDAIEKPGRHGSRIVRAEPDCLKADQPGVDRQLTLYLSVKRQKIQLDGRAWNIVVAGGVSRDGLIPDRSVQPVIIVQQESISDDSVVSALVEFVDRTVVAALRQR
jgi:hypothetical protein